MIYIILGTRAQLVKMAPIIKEFERLQWPLTLIHTGQHKEGINELCKDFKIKTNWHSLYSDKQEVKTIYNAIKWLSIIIFRISFNPSSLISEYKESSNNIILVHGDTFSTVIGALIGKRLNIKVAHIESGLRSFHIFNPFPEEINRLLTFYLADIAFCPGRWAIRNLNNFKNLEKIDTGYNSLLDTLRNTLESSEETSTYIIPTTEYGVISIHRFENIFFSAQLRKIINQLIKISTNYHLVFVLHPATNKRLERTNLLEQLNATNNIELRDRTSYANFIKLLSSSKFVITDGGSNQEELSYMNIPTLLMRKTTERQEGLQSNVTLGCFSEQNLTTFIENLGTMEKPAMSLPSISPSANICTAIGKITQQI